MKAIIHAMRAHLIVFQDPEDDTVEIDNARLIYDAARHPKSFVALPGAGHLLNKSRKDAPYVADILAATARRYCTKDG